MRLLGRRGELDGSGMDEEAGGRVLLGRCLWFDRRGRRRTVVGWRKKRFRWKRRGDVGDVVVDDVMR